MKKLLLFILFILACIFPFAGGAAAQADGAASTAPQYARVLSDSVTLYRTNSGAEENENRYFLLPEGYYVGLSDITSENYYKVAYDGISGYVKAEQVDIVSYVPKLKYAVGQTLKIELKDSDFCNFREFPATSAQKLIETGIPNGTQDIKFFNYVAAGAVNWYFIEYGGLRGYVHGDYAVVTKGIAVNDGAAEPALEITGPSETPGTKSPPPLKTTTLVILIAAIGIPAIVILFVLFRPRRRRPAYRSARPNAKRIPRYLDEGYDDRGE